MKKKRQVCFYFRFIQVKKWCFASVSFLLEHAYELSADTMARNVDEDKFSSASTILVNMAVLARILVFPPDYSSLGCHFSFTFYTSILQEEKQKYSKIILWFGYLVKPTVSNRAANSTLRYALKALPYQHFVGPAALSPVISNAFLDFMLTFLRRFSCKDTGHFHGK